MYIFTGCLLNVMVPAQNRENNLESFFFATALKVYHTKLSAESRGFVRISYPPFAVWFCQAPPTPTIPASGKIRPSQTPSEASCDGSDLRSDATTHRDQCLPSMLKAPSPLSIEECDGGGVQPCEPMRDRPKPRHIVAEGT